MRLSNLGWTGIVGMFAVVAGLNLLWRHRADILIWAAAYVAAFRREVSRRAEAKSSAPEETGVNECEEPVSLFPDRAPKGALSVVLGLYLILTGQAILFLDLLS
jgi:hypothetical protein